MNKVFKFIIGVIFLIIFINFYLGGGVEKQVQEEVNKIEIQVAIDAEKQYEIAKRNGSDMDAYVQVGFVCTAYLQANDEVNYKKWKVIENQLAKDLGLK